MKLQDKLNILKQSITECKMTTCYFTYEKSYVHYYVSDVNEKFVLGIEEFDFKIKGYELRKMSRLKSVCMRNDKTNEINDMMGLTNNLVHPEVDISSWKNIFSSRCLDNELIEIECDNDGNFYIGKVVKILNNCIYFLELDPHGIWDDEPFIINYKDIDGIKWNTWYLNGWKWYFENKN